MPGAAEPAAQYAPEALHAKMTNLDGQYEPAGHVPSRTDPAAQ
jgi:hypothetical protein